MSRVFLESKKFSHASWIFPILALEGGWTKPPAADACRTIGAHCKEEPFPQGSHIKQEYPKTSTVQRAGKRKRGETKPYRPAPDVSLVKGASLHPDRKRSASAPRGRSQNPDANRAFPHAALARCHRRAFATVCSAGLFRKTWRRRASVGGSDNRSQSSPMLRELTEDSSKAQATSQAGTGWAQLLRAKTLAEHEILSHMSLSKPISYNMFFLTCYSFAFFGF